MPRKRCGFPLTAPAEFAARRAHATGVGTTLSAARPPLSFFETRTPPDYTAPGFSDTRPGAVRHGPQHHRTDPESPVRDLPHVYIEGGITVHSAGVRAAP